ncbi:hypothetical protein C8A03DRAFT_17345 [Achaetomium macrosporum]|uniref:FAD-binding domain-containing protein n=1 Tax=Achaetomium macrosporum TaxID=79813 RepID=A0AAN7H954_9PEZI|nr:hypothetical protein C8A03DRAFT_17345 [Achaetomium macrosporum]
MPHIAIIGAGITGTTLSLGLTARGIAHTVYEQGRHPAELGAGLGLGPNAARALRIAHAGLYERFLEVCTPRDMKWRPSSSSSSSVSGGSGSFGSSSGIREEGRGEKQGEEEPVWIEFLDGTSPLAARELKPAFRIPCPYPEGHGAVHRARWLEVLMGMVAEGVVQFGKRLEGIEDRGDGGRLVLRFEDGTTAQAGAVVGCDGVKSKVREVLVGGRDKEGAKCGYSGKYAYRCMIPMERAVEELGPGRAGCSSLWMGHGRHVLTFPVGRPGPDQLLNLVAFVTDSNESWPSQDARSFTLPATRDDALLDFEQGGFSNTWGLFDLAAHPLPSFHAGRILVIGDAAHASTPHHGSGAGFCMEDVAVLSSLLEEMAAKHHPPEVDSSNQAHKLQAVFAAFDASRRERDQWLVQSSRRAAELYEWRLPNTGKGWFETMRKDIEERQAVCWGIDLDKAIAEAREDVRRRLAVASRC